MPSYEYKCADNGHLYIEQRSMSEDQQRKVCPQPDCKSELIRVFNSTIVTFKGKGFYSTGG